MKSLAEGVRKLAEADREVRECVVAIAERRSNGLSTAALEEKLRSTRAQGDVYRAVVDRQQTIKSLWALPTPAFKRKAAEVKELEGRITIAQGLQH